MKLILPIIFISSVIDSNQALEIYKYRNKCGACLQANERFRYTCTRCIDNKFEKDSKCGKNIGNVLECSRGSKDYNMC